MTTSHSATVHSLYYSICIHRRVLYDVRHMQTCTYAAAAVRICWAMVVPKSTQLHVIAECQAIYNTHALHVRPDITLQLQCQHRICWQSSILAAYKNVHI